MLTDAIPLALPWIMSDEGCRLAAYPDPISHGAPWTIGYGCTGDGIEKGTVWTQQQAKDELEKRVDNLSVSLFNAIPWVISLSPVRQAALLNMAYQMGLHGLLGFPHTLAACRVGDFDEASELMLESVWAKETPERAHRISDAMKTGVMPTLETQ